MYLKDRKALLKELDVLLPEADETRGDIESKKRIAQGKWSKSDQVHLPR
jgi:hypothetical protein